MRGLLLLTRVTLIERFSVLFVRKVLQTRIDNLRPVSSANIEKQLLIDVSVIFKSDARTGIQRVVRALLLRLSLDCPAGYRVKPVFATRRHGYCYAPEGFGRPDGVSATGCVVTPVRVQSGDVFLGLDLAAHLLPLHQAELARWKQLGATIHIVVYDLLPVMYPQWFNARTTRNFRRWLRTVAIFSDSAICISTTVRSDLSDWLRVRYGLTPDVPELATIPLGADLASNISSRAMPDDTEPVCRLLVERPSALMVGTIEPRKGHQDILDAFEVLWRQGMSVNLVLIGKPGWRTEELQKRLLNHGEHGKHLHWLSDVNDEVLETAYRNCTGVIAASYAEGFGLPIIEAVNFGKPVLARDIGIFREIAQPGVSFFRAGDRISLARVVEKWMIEITVDDHVVPTPGGNYSWNESSTQLLGHLQRVGNRIMANERSTTTPVLK